MSCTSLKCKDSSLQRTPKKMKRQVIDQEKIFEKQLLIKDLHPQGTQELLKLSHKKTNNLTKKKQAEDLNRYLIKVHIQMATEHVKRCAIIYIIRKLQTIRWHYVSVRMAKTQNIGRTTCWQGMDHRNS